MSLSVQSRAASSSAIQARLGVAVSMAMASRVRSSARTWTFVAIGPMTRCRRSIGRSSHTPEIWGLTLERLQGLACGAWASTPRQGFLLIADLTGYTAYLSSGELEHAPVIAGDLIETVVGRLEPPFRLAKLEGDAAFLFVEDGRADGSLLIDAIEAAYVGFRRRLHSIERATACSCQACGLAPRLDLKLFLHHGAFVHAPIAGRDELAGSSVILVHRLLKGTTADAAHDADGAARGFAIVTDDAMRALALDPADLGATERRETIEPFGEVVVHHLDLEERWQAERGLRRIDIDASRAVVDERVVVEAPAADVWAR